MSQDIESLYLDTQLLASERVLSLLRGIEANAIAIGDCASMYENIDGMQDGSIECQFLAQSRPLADDLQDLVRNLRTHKKNGAKCRLVSYTPPLSDAQDQLQLTFCPTDYHSFLAINTRLDENLLPNNMTIREKYWRRSFDLATSPLPNMFYVHLLLVSSDNKAIILRRSKFVEEYKGAWSATLEEQLRPKQAGGDYDRDVFDTATRGVREEIGIEVERKDVTFLSLTFEYPNFNVGLAGIVKAKASAQEIWRFWQLRYADQETSRFAAVPFAAGNIMPLVRNQYFDPRTEGVGDTEAAPWHPTARFRLLFGLRHLMLTQSA